MMKDGEFYVDMPEVYKRRELNALYREIPLKDTAFRLLRKYFNAMGNLYGVITLRKAYEIITDLDPKLVSMEQFLAFAEIARHECDDYTILGLDELYYDGELKDPLDREIIDLMLLNGDIDSYHELLRSHQGKPYYVPRKKELLAYDDPFYYEPNEDTKELIRFFTDKLHLSDVFAAAVFEEILYGVRYTNAGFPQVQKRLTDMGIKFGRKGDFHRFAELYQAFHNNARMQCNRGHTPNEMYDLTPPEERIPKSISLGPNIRKALADGTMDPNELGQSILNAELPSEDLRLSLLKELAEAIPTKGPAEKKQKIGRNDPCPCGSGKKYKKCCGK